MIVERETQYYKPLEVTVTTEDAGKQVRQILHKKLGISRSLLTQVKQTAFGLTVNEQRSYTTAPVQAGDIIRLRMEKESSEDILPEPMELDILFEDDYLLIINKPAGIIVHPTKGRYTGTLANGVVAYWQQKGEQFRFRPIHRLDEETSGVVAIAKTAYIHQQLSEQLQADEVEKVYRAYIYGQPLEHKATIDAPIDRDPDDPHTRTVIATGYRAVTHYEVIQSNKSGTASIVKLRLETGRTHQIRVHMRYIGCPLIGDKLYRLSDYYQVGWEETVQRQALHAEMLSFIHPMSKQRMSWYAPIPVDLLQLEEEW
ncbi:RluA family pseudouridine synthase [Paenibacillus yanchengensis]|uniref:Pseudouridine synthase n=1 Tax=Paenibacillus yanchengensis TaxID=2035833 RepID=A0ABW4YM55_9BACL